MPDLNRESLEIWNSLKPMVDEEIKSQTRGAVQRRKAKVTTAPSLSTNKIGVTEPYCAEIFIPFVSNLISATVGDYVWIEFAYGATNAYASMFASADEKDWHVAGDLSVVGNAGIGGDLGVSGATSLQNATVNGVLGVTNRRAYAYCSAGWYRIFQYSASDSGDMVGGQGIVVDFNIQRSTNAENHSITYRGVSGGAGAFVNESSRSNAQYIQKIRYIYNSTLLEAYVDIYLSNSTELAVGVDINVHGAFYTQQSRAVIQNLVPVAASPSGETVLTTYDFLPNTDRTGTITAESGITFGELHVVQHGKTVNLSGHAQGSFAGGTTGKRIGTISGVSNPSQIIRATCGCGSAAYYAYNSGYFLIETNGDITVRTEVAASAVTFNVTYLID